MHPALLDRSRYNPFIKARAFDGLWWTASTSNRCAMIRAPSDLTLIRTRVLHTKGPVELSPTWRKLKKQIGFITCVDLKGQRTSDNWKAYMYYNHILRVNMHIHTCHLRATQALPWVRVALPRGLACHVAFTWVPRKNTPFFSFFFNYF